MNDSGGFDRRDFLKVLGTGLLGGSLAGCKTGEAEDPFALKKPPVPGAEKWTEFQEKLTTTACAQCAAGCGVRVRVVGGRAVKIEGHPDNPINRGGIGPRGLSGLQVLYDPDRVTQPMRRKGPRGSGTWEPIDWDAAIAEVAARLSKLRDAGEPHRLAVVSGRERGRVLDLLRRFCESYGTPNLGDGLSRRFGAIAQAASMTQGVHEIPAYDWTNTRYVLSVGAGLLESSCQAIFFTRGMAELRRGNAGTRAKIVQVEPSFSRTAAQGDEWIGIAPGTHAAFVLGIAHVLVRDGLHDAAWIDEHAFGFEPWTTESGVAIQGFKDLLAADYSPEQVAEICGVKPAVIERIAAEMAARRPAFAMTDERATLASNGLQVALAVSALNALLGSIDRPGGVLVQRRPPVAELPPVVPDEIAVAGLAMPRLDGAGTRYPLARTTSEALPEALLSGKPYALDTLLLHYANPAYAGMAPGRWAEALAKVPFVVTFTPFMDETAEAIADLVLPDHSYLERWEDSAPAPSIGTAVYGIRQPVVEPLHQTRAAADVVLQLAAKLGGPVAEALPWEKLEDVLALDIEALQAAARGSITADGVKAFRRKLLQDGYWSDDSYPFESWADVLKGPSGKYELFSQEMWRRLEELAAAGQVTPDELVASMGHEGPAHLACMPHHRSPTWGTNPSTHAFALEVYEPGTYAEGSGANLPLLQELVTVRGQKPYTTQVEMSHEAAAELGIANGNLVEVSSAAGMIRVPASIRRGMRKDVVRIARGGGHSAFGRFAKGWGANVMSLIVPATDPLAGVPALGSTRVSVRKVRP